MDRLTFSDERLMTLAAGGDQQAFQALVRRLGSAILTLARRLTGDHSRAEEAFADAITKVWLGRRTYRQGSPARPWIMAITTNVCREQARKLRWVAAVEGDADRLGGGGGSGGPEAGIAGEENAARVGAALRRLPERQREALVLRVWGELEYAQIAEAMGGSESTARSNMHLALGAMRRMLGSMHGGGNGGERGTRPIPGAAGMGEARSDTP